MGGLGALSLATVTVEEVTASKPDERKKRIKGHIEPDTPNWVYVPFDVSDNVTELHISYDYNKSQKNLLDIGIFDSSGYELGNADGFRGWSGGERTEFMLSRSEATPGYYPGEIKAGTWNVILGPYRVGAGGSTIRLKSPFGKASRGRRSSQHLHRTTHSPIPPGGSAATFTFTKSILMATIHQKTLSKVR
ncbi:hypothetical protein GCM10009000_081590 [Halobacterium noricense]|uniref:Uncharacterized protein n=1 Tax=Haladaptatus pallidirubidus TaxID=1008152 RepID=A0AAV3UQ92_9EURY